MAMNEQVFYQLKEMKPILEEKFGIEKFALFGSMAKGKDTNDSDVDIAVISMRKKNYFTLIRAMNFLSEQLNREVDMGFLDSVRPFVRKRIEKDLLYV